MNEPHRPEGDAAAMEELSLLIADVLHGAADADRRAQLEAWLLRDPAARALYRRHVNLYGGLRSMHAGGAAAGPAFPLELKEQIAAESRATGETTTACEPAKSSSPIAAAATEPAAPPATTAEAAFSVPVDATIEDEHASDAPQRGRSIGSLLATLATIAAGLFLIVGWYRSLPPRAVSITPRSATPVATSTPLASAPAVLSRASWVRWGGGRGPAIGSDLPLGLLELTHGLAEITFLDGAVVLVEAPASIEVLTADRAYLRTGRIVARVPMAGDFTIETPTAEFAERGAECGIGVGPAGDTEVQVFSGVVRAESRGGATGAFLAQRVEAGQAFAIDRQTQLREIAFTAERFVRTFPVIPNAEPGGPLFNRSRYDTVHVVPPPGPVAIDAELSDWDATAAFKSACAQPYDTTYNVTGMMMYDAERLYLAAHVRDPAPMRSVAERYAFQGGSVIVRLATDRALGWPLDALSPHYLNRRGAPRGPRPEDRSDRIAHITMWYHRPTQQARLHLTFGMDFHGAEPDPAGWSGVFQADADGLGYTIEYAIPWSLLKAEHDPPRAGDTLAALWNVHWSDVDGRLCRGHLEEIVSDPAVTHPFMQAKAWGRAVFYGEGNLPPGTIRPRPSTD